SLFGRVGLARLGALAQTAGDGPLVDADDDHTEVRQGSLDVRDPLEGDRLRYDDDRTAGSTALACERGRRPDGERRSNPHGETKPTARVRVDASRPGDLMRVEHDRGVPPRELERLGAVAVGPEPLPRALVPALDDPLALRVGLQPGAEALGPLRSERQADVVHL